MSGRKRRKSDATAAEEQHEKKEERGRGIRKSSWSNTQTLENNIKMLKKEPDNCCSQIHWAPIQEGGRARERFYRCVCGDMAAKR